MPSVFDAEADVAVVEAADEVPLQPSSRVEFVMCVEQQTGLVLVPNS